MRLNTRPTSPGCAGPSRSVPRECGRTRRPHGRCHVPGHPGQVVKASEDLLFRSGSIIHHSDDLDVTVTAQPSRTLSATFPEPTITTRVGCRRPGSNLGRPRAAGIRATAGTPDQADLCDCGDAPGTRTQTARNNVSRMPDERARSIDPGGSATRSARPASDTNRSGTAPEETRECSGAAVCPGPGPNPHNPRRASAARARARTSAVPRAAGCRNVRDDSTEALRTASACAERSSPGARAVPESGPMRCRGRAGALVDAPPPGQASATRGRCSTGSPPERRAHPRRPPPHQAMKPPEGHARPG